MAIALTGVMAMQLYFFRESYQLQEKLFDQSVHEALTRVVERIEKRDANNFLEKKAENIGLPATETVTQKPLIVKRSVSNSRNRTSGRLSAMNHMLNEKRKEDSIFRIRDSLFKARNPNVLVFDDALSPEELKDQQFDLRVDITEYIDAFGQLRTLREITNNKVPALAMAAGGQIAAATASLRDSVRQYIVFDPVYGTSLRTIPKPKLRHNPPPEPPEPKRKNKVEKVQELFASETKKGDVFKNLAEEYGKVRLSLNERIHPQTLDSMLRLELINRSINSNYEYKVTSAERDSLIFRRASNQTKFLPNNSYEIPLFPKDIIMDSGMLTITFPDKNTIILANLTAMMSLSGGLLLILIFCFGYTIHTILMQKKLSEMKTDFINNMTHEFKTPVATIMIASEALRDPDLTTDKKRIDRLANIIYDENVRLGSHIERVLNIAKIDKGDLKLEHKDVEMNDLLSAIVDSMALQLQKRNATIDLQLDAGQSTIMGDELHLSNIIFNLLDNANKYSPKDPEIKISTLNSGRNLIIRVADKGIGMNRDQLGKIFDQFYRIPTGNVHDVKGFGLGLSYVANIVKKLHGTIKVRSEKDKGSEFEISLPLKNS
ncbi:two-component system, OmpR family, phosphate regulon sensor histidine kinase PhoR [Daejeonella lutea]|uniref:histidine kinase n=2 Tax=Daejeonella lutea TaxID=572036 RepID=A0A1T5DVK5_9SPHI|nr:two-component system, OmpR family, phosphate regulon sensor histidine kinase PhoR [Daejeonella lutea]